MKRNEKEKKTPKNGNQIFNPTQFNVQNKRITKRSKTRNITSHTKKVTWSKALRMVFQEGNRNCSGPVNSDTLLSRVL